MEFFPKLTTINFMGQRWGAMIFSVSLFLFSTVAIIVNGLNLGLDFTGGTQIEMDFKQVVSVDAARDKIQQAGFSQAVVQSYGTAHTLLIRLSPHTHNAQNMIKQRIQTILPQGHIQRVEFIGPQVGNTLITNGVLAIITSLIATMIYIALRFEYRFAVSAAISLIHDPVLILGVFAFFHLEFNLIALAALLTILGYSLNDTIVVYDRVRENFRKIRKATPVEVMNLSINQTLSRTIMTSGLTLAVVIALCVLGGETLRGFSIALIIGIVIGTYSSIYVAGALALLFGLNREALMPADKRPS